MAALDEWTKALFAGFDPDDEEGRLALLDIVSFAREKETEAEIAAEQLSIATADYERKLKDAEASHEAQLADLKAEAEVPASPAGVEYVQELEEMVDLLEAENAQLNESAAGRRRALRDAREELANTQMALARTTRTAALAKRNLEEALAEANRDCELLRHAAEEDGKYIEELEEDLTNADDELRTARANAGDVHGPPRSPSPPRRGRRSASSSLERAERRSASPRSSVERRRRPPSADRRSPPGRRRPPSAEPPRRGSPRRSASPRRQSPRRQSPRRRTPSPRRSPASPRELRPRVVAVSPKPPRPPSDSPERDAAAYLTPGSPAVAPAPIPPHSVFDDSANESERSERRHRASALAAAREKRRRRRVAGSAALAPPSRHFTFPRAAAVRLPPAMAAPLRFSAPVAPSDLASPSGVVVDDDEVASALEGADPRRRSPPRNELQQSSPVDPSFRYRSGSGRIEASPREHF